MLENVAPASKRKAADAALAALGDDWFTFWTEDLAISIPPFLRPRSGPSWWSLHESIATIAPHWDGFVDLLDEGRGYAAAVALLDRLGHRVVSDELARENAEVDRVTARTVRHVLLAESEGERLDGELQPPQPRDKDDRGSETGDAETMVSTLGWPARIERRPTRGSAWRWESVPAVGTGPDRYRLVLLRGGHPAPYPIDQRLALFDVTSTWRDAIDTVRSVQLELERRREGDTERALRAFRHYVLSQVTRLYELTGAVYPLQEYAPSGRWEPNDEDYAIACAAYEALCENEAVMTSKTGLLRHLVEMAADSNAPLRASERKIKDALMRLGAFVNRQGEGRGSGNTDTARRDFELLVRRLKEISRTHCEKES